MKKNYKRIIALVLSVLLLIGTIPVFAADTLPVVVVDPTGETSGSYTTMTAAIDALGGEAGKVYVKGALSAAGAALEGTIENREPIIIAGYDDNAANGTITIDTAKVTGESWTKGDITFENITILPGGTGSAGKSEYGFSSGDHTITFGEGIKTGAAASGIWNAGMFTTPADSRLNVGSYPGSNSDLNVNITSGNYYTVQALLGGDKSASTTNNMNVTINVSGANGKTSPNNGTYIEYLGIGGAQNPPTSSYALHTINGDVTYNLNGGYIQCFSVASYGNSAVNVLGDTIVNISDAYIQDPIFTVMRANTASDHADYQNNKPEYNNIAIIVDASKTSGRAILGSSNTNNCGINSKNPDSYPMAEGKYMIGIYNNIPDNYSYTGAPNRFNNAFSYTLTATGNTEYYVFNRCNYRLVVKGGYAQPVFVRTDPDDPSTSYLKGFTFDSNVDGLVPYANGEALKVNESYPMHEGKTVYDLSEYVFDDPYEAVKTTGALDKNLTKITFAEDATPRIPVVSTDESYVAPDGYRKYSTISDAINALGTEGGTIYIAGKYIITNAATEFTNTKNIADGKKIIIRGIGENPTQNELGFGDGNTTLQLRNIWLHCDLEFNNLTLSGKAGEAHGFNSYGSVLTFGDNLVTNFTGYMMGSLDSNKFNRIVINSGTYQNFAAALKTNGSYSNTGCEYTLNGGNFQAGILTGARSNNASAPIKTHGYFTYNINGGNFVDANNNKTSIDLYSLNGYSAGVTTVNVKGGNAAYVNLRLDKDYVGSAQVTKHTNKVAIIDASKTTTNINSYLTNVDITEERSTKYIAIINNYESGARIVNAQNGLDYAFYVNGGELNPVFYETTSGDASTATLKGFTITPSAENEGKVVTINNIKSVPDENGIYDLSAFEDSGVVSVVFKEVDATDYSQFIGFANDLNNSYNKLKAGQSVNVVYMGGSITHGAGIDNNISASWRERTTTWLKSAFPSATINAMSKAASGTGTTYGMHRNVHDIIDVNPDILFIEFAINDNYDGITGTVAGQQLETMVREIKFNRPNCDIIIVISTDINRAPEILADGTLHEQAITHEAVAKAYGIPIIYAGKAVCSFIDPALKDDYDALKAVWLQYMVDNVHPNEAGHEIYFNTIRTLFETVYSGTYTANNINVDVSDGNTIISDRLFDGNRTFITAEETVTVKNSATAPVRDKTKNLGTMTKTGFTVDNSKQTFQGGIVYNGSLVLPITSDGSLTVNFKGTELVIISTTFRANDKIYYSLDGGAEVAYTVKESKRWPIKLLTGIESGEHTVTIRIAASDLVASDRTITKIYAVSTFDDATSTGNTGYVKKDEITNLDSFKASGDVPFKKYHLFAGWYESETAEKAMNATEFAAAETAVAKFIPKEVLDVKWQLGKGEDGKANLRLISTVDSLQYQKVIFNVSVVGRETPFDPLESTTVYTGISGYVDGNEQNYAPTINSISSAYFMTHIITGIPVDFHDNEFTVSASVVTKDGQIITGDEFTFTLKSATDYDKVMGN